MSMDHQFWVIAKVGSRYRTLDVTRGLPVAGIMEQILVGGC
jgi:hypothetical protein